MASSLFVTVNSQALNSSDTSKQLDNIDTDCSDSVGNYTQNEVRKPACLEAITDLNLALYKSVPVREATARLLGHCNRLRRLQLTPNRLQGGPKGRRANLLNENFNCALDFRDVTYGKQGDPDSDNALVLDLLFCMHGTPSKSEDFACQNLKRRDVSPI